MADPTLTHSVTGTSAVATTTASFGFTATAGRLLMLVACADDYSSGSPSGFTQVQTIGAAEGAFFGATMWWKLAAGGETSAAYVIGSASPSCWAVLEFDSVAGTGTLDTSAKNYATGTVATATSASITPATGRRFVVAALFGSDGNRALTGMGTWTNSYTEVADVVTVLGAGTQDQLAVAALALDGGVATTTTATFEPGAAQSAGSIVAAFVVAGGAAGGAVPRIVVGASGAAHQAASW